MPEEDANDRPHGDTSATTREWVLSVGVCDERLDRSNLGSEEASLRCHLNLTSLELNTSICTARGFEILLLYSFKVSISLILTPIPSIKELIWSFQEFIESWRDERMKDFTGKKDQSRVDGFFISATHKFKFSFQPTAAARWRYCSSTFSFTCSRGASGKDQLGGQCPRSRPTITPTNTNSWLACLSPTKANALLPAPDRSPCPRWSKRNRCKDNIKANIWHSDLNNVGACVIQTRWPGGGESVRSCARQRLTSTVLPKPAHEGKRPKPRTSISHHTAPRYEGQGSASSPIWRPTRIQLDGSYTRLRSDLNSSAAPDPLPPVVFSRQPTFSFQNSSSVQQSVWFSPDWLNLATERAMNQRSVPKSASTMNQICTLRY